ncbi:hypothetical protein AMECASPLE_038816 [Ameca splendens]|uniref:Uncharacterized protein n=1 Tax=Ameca splendens TaxID=208324 RepID=A0ABV0ZI58_9TELE
MVNPNSQIPGPFRQIRRNNFLQDLSHFTPESRNRNLPPILCKDHIQSAIQLMYHLSLSVDCSADPIIHARQPYNGQNRQRKASSSTENRKKRQLHIHDVNLPFHHIPKVLYWIEIW